MNIIQTSGNFGMVSQLCVCVSVCVKPQIILVWKLVLWAFAQGLYPESVCVYICTEASTGRETGKEGEEKRKT